MSDFARAFCDAANDHERQVALSDLAVHFRGTNEKPVERFLAQVACNESHSKDIRLIAYIVLFEVANRPLKDLPPLRDFKIPENLELSFLNQYL